MAEEEEKNETTEEETPAAEAPEEPAAEAPAEEPEAAAEPAAEEAPAEEAPAEEPVAEAPAAPAEDEEPAPTHPKEIRKLARRQHTGEAKPARTPDERIAERQAKRAKNAAERRRWRAKQREKRKAGGPREGTPKAEHAGTGGRRERQGIVVSAKADKTITVQIDSARQHRTYGKIVRTSTKLHAHDEANEANAGDTVRVVESRPLSASKRWRLAEIVERGR